MAAGLGFKDFTTGEVLTAADVDGYLMQGVWVFASAAARDAAVTSPQEGNFAYLKDTNTTTYYTGSAWTNLDTTGMVNPMTTTGDIIYSSSGSTPARLGIGSTGNVLTVAGGVPSWAAASSGGMTSLASGSLSGASVDLQSISGSYEHLQLVLRNSRINTGSDVYVRFNNLSTGIYNMLLNYNDNGSAGAYAWANLTELDFCWNQQQANTGTPTAIIDIWDYADTSNHKQFNVQYSYTNNSGNIENTRTSGACRTTNAIDRITIFAGTGSWSAGTYELFGVK